MSRTVHDAPPFFDTPPGQLVREWASARLDAAVEGVLGDCALQIGLPSLDALRANRMPEHWLLGDERLLDSGDSVREDLRCVVAAPEALPFANQVFDLVVLPHSLDFSEHPQEVLAEAVRVLAPEGRLIVLGFNPLGPWWFRQQFVRFGCKSYLPPETNPIGILRLKDWLSLLGLRITEGAFGVWRPARRTRSALRRWAWLEKAGDRWFPQCSNLYLLSAVKKIPGRTPPAVLPFADTLSALAGKAGKKAVPRPMSSKIET